MYSGAGGGKEGGAKDSRRKYKSCNEIGTSVSGLRFRMEHPGGRRKTRRKIKQQRIARSEDKRLIRISPKDAMIEIRG